MIRISETVRAALAENRPVVALETAVLTHGLASGLALTVYREMTAAVAGAGALPAPVGVLGGEVVVGLDEGELERLARGTGVRKAALADLAPLAAGKADGGTTVSATLWAATRVGVGVMATGGIGGVHRGAGESFDISADLRALSRYGGCVVASGAKSFCDLQKTLEVLETYSIPVVGYNTAKFPAFLAASTGLELRYRVETPSAAAKILLARDALRQEQSLFLVQPVPEKRAMEADELESALQRALDLAKEESITGSALTPFLLTAVAKLTGGRSVEANRALLAANAALAARVAVEVSRMKEESPGQKEHPTA